MTGKKLRARKPSKDRNLLGEKCVGRRVQCKFYGLKHTRNIHISLVVNVLHMPEQKKGVYRTNCKHPLNFIGGPSRSRTGDLLIKSQMLYQLS
jgi:hypothetical protein